MLAPVVLFLYNRPDHAARTIAALAANNFSRDTNLIIFCDGPKNISDLKGVEATRLVARSTSGFKSVRIVERLTNLGLANSVIKGVSEVCASYGRIIVLEDDLVTSQFFLSFMNAALDKYEKNNNVGSIHGYWYPSSIDVPETFFLRGASCWGWATWSRSWKNFEPDGSKLLNALRSRGLTKEFDLEGAIAYTRMLNAQIAGQNDSWAIRWHASTFLAGLLQLSPGRSLVRNIGFDGTGTHCADTLAFNSELSVDPVRVDDITVEQSECARAAVIHYHKSTRQTFFQKSLGKMRRIFKGLAH